MRESHLIWFVHGLRRFIDATMRQINCLEVIDTSRGIIKGKICIETGRNLMTLKCN